MIFKMGKVLYRRPARGTQARFELDPPEEGCTRFFPTRISSKTYPNSPTRLPDDRLFLTTKAEASGPYTETKIHDLAKRDSVRNGRSNQQDRRLVRRSKSR